MIGMVERMSRAIWSASKPPCIWEEAPDILQAYWTSIALAALREMREPTEVMVDGAYKGASLDDKWWIEDDRDYRKSFRAAIDAEIAAYEVDHASPVLRPPS